MRSTLDLQSSEDSSAPRRGLDGRATPSSAWSLPWLRSRWQSCHRRADLGCQAASAGPTGGARRVLAGRLVVWRSRMPNAFRAVRPFPVRVASGSPGRAGWSGRCPAEYDRAGGVRKPIRSWCPSWTPDTTARTSDGDQACGRSGIQHGCRCHDRRVPMLVAARVAEGSMRIAVLSGQD